MLNSAISVSNDVNNIQVAKTSEKKEDYLKKKIPFWVPFLDPCKELLFCFLSEYGLQEILEPLHDLDFLLRLIACLGQVGC